MAVAETYSAAYVHALRRERGRLLALVERIAELAAVSAEATGCPACPRVAVLAREALRPPIDFATEA